MELLRIIELLERLLGKSIRNEPAVLNAIKKHEQDLYRMEIEMQLQQLEQQAQLQRQQVFLAPRQAGKSQAIKELGCPPPGQVIHNKLEEMLKGQAGIAAAPIPFGHSALEGLKAGILSPEEAARKYMKEALGFPPEPVEPAETVMEFSLEE